MSQARNAERKTPPCPNVQRPSFNEEERMGTDPSKERKAYLVGVSCIHCNELCYCTVQS